MRSEKVTNAVLVSPTDPVSCQSLLTAMDVTLIVLTVLQLCVCISAAVLGVRALSGRAKGQV